MNLYSNESNAAPETHTQPEQHNLCYAQYEIDFSGNTNNTPLKLISITQCGTNILLTDDASTVVLSPGSIYLVSFNVRGTIPPESYIGITPIDEPEAPTADYSAQAHCSVNNAEVTVSNTFLISASTGKQVQFLFNTSLDVEVPLTGTISMVCLASNE